MKKVSLWSILMLVVLTLPLLAACGGDGDDDPGLTVTPSSISMHYEDTQQLSAQGATSYKSNDEFVAKVDQAGLVTGGHVGTTQIIASNGKKTGICEVTITPEYDLYDTPILDWGVSASTISSKETHKLESSTDDYLIFNYQKGNTACAMSYAFENGKLKSVIAILNYSSYVSAGYYLLERYQPIGEDEGIFVFLDALTKDKAKTAVAFSTATISGSKVTRIIYMPATSTSSSMRSVQSNNLPTGIISDIIKDKDF